MREDLDRKAELTEKEIGDILFSYYKINNFIKRNVISASIVTTGLGAVLGNPNIMYLGASVYQAQLSV